MSALDNLRARVAESPLMASLEASFDGLSARDRKLFIALVAFFALVLVGGGAFFMRNKLNALQAQVDSRRAALNAIRAQQSEYTEARARLDEIEEELKKHEGTPVSSFVERAASSAQIRDNLSGIKESGTQQIGNLQQLQHRIELSRVELPKLLDFLYELEGTGYPLRIKDASIKVVRVSGANMMNVSLDVASYRPMAGEEG